LENNKFNKMDIEVNPSESNTPGVDESLRDYITRIVNKLHDLSGKLEEELVRCRNNPPLETQVDNDIQMRMMLRGEHIIRTLDSISNEVANAEEGIVNPERYTRFCLTCRQNGEGETPEESGDELASDIEDMEVEDRLQGPPRRIGR